MRCASPNRHLLERHQVQDLPLDNLQSQQLQISAPTSVIPTQTAQRCACRACFQLPPCAENRWRSCHHPHRADDDKMGRSMLLFALGSWAQGGCTRPQAQERAAAREAEKGAEGRHRAKLVVMALVVASVEGAAARRRNPCERYLPKLPRVNLECQKKHLPSEAHPWCFG